MSTDRFALVASLTNSQDFRSENGLYSLIQAQYDAALRNPPWETTDSFDIDDRPKKKRRVTDRWYYEPVPGTGPATQANASSELPEPRSPKSQFASQSTTGRNTRTSSPNRISSPLSSPRSVTPEPPSDFFLHKEPVLEPTITRRQTRSSIALLSSSSHSLHSQTSRSSSVFTTDDNSKEAHSQSDSSAPSCSGKAEDTASISEHEQELQCPSSPPVAPQEDVPKDDPPLSQQSTTRTLPNLKGRDLFDSMVWSDPFTTSIFYMFISSLREKIQNEVTSTTKTHAFLRVLRDGGRLVRNYTQNIDCLEEREGLCTDLVRGTGNRSRFSSTQQRQPRPEFIQSDSPHSGGVEVVLLHGSLAVLRCGICAKVCPWIDGRRESTLAGFAPDCPSCAECSIKRSDRGRRGLAIGRLRPDIVLYGEEHPHASLISPLITHDLSLGPDFLLIMGTSLKVHGLKVMVKEFAKAVHSRGGKVVFVNQTKPPESTWGEFIDYWVEWDCDEWVVDLYERRGDIWLPQGSQVEPDSRRKSTSDTKLPSSRPSNPVSQRDCKRNAAFLTFHILDSLGQNLDSNGNTAARRIYWPLSLPVNPRTAPSTVRADGSKPLLAPPPRKALPVTKTSSQGNTKKRKSCPSALEDKGVPKSSVNTEWEKIRKLAPGLPEKPPEPPRIAMADVLRNRNFSTNLLFRRSFGNNDFPNIPGIERMNLVTHPPFGTTIPIHTPRSITKPVDSRPITHSYGTRASARLSEISGDRAVNVDEIPRPIASRRPVKEKSNAQLPSPSPLQRTINANGIGPAEDPITIQQNANPTLQSHSPVDNVTFLSTSRTFLPAVVVTKVGSFTATISNAITKLYPSTHSSPPQVQEKISVEGSVFRSPASRSENANAVANEQPPTPPTSDPLSPRDQRIKRLGSIDSILDSPSQSGNWSFSQEQEFYDAMEE